MIWVKFSEARVVVAFRPNAAFLHDERWRRSAEALLERGRANLNPLAPRPRFRFNGGVPMKTLNSLRLTLALALCAQLASAAATNAPAPKQTLSVAMRDGVKLATDVYLPSTHGAFPVVLVRTPYNKNGAAGLGNDGAARGYAIVAQDVRGRYASEGENLPFDRDVDDGRETIEWVARQPWCNGRIGTWGGSAGAITQFQMAASGTQHIAAQHLIVGAPSLYDVVYLGGVFRKSLIEDWLRMTQWSSNALPRWVGHPRYDDYWRARDATRHYAKINAPAVHIGGYWDIFAQATIDAFVGYQTRGGPKARGRQKLILGPWPHGVLQEKAGELTFRGAKKPPGDVHDAWRWFDHWLKGAANGIDRAPAVTYYVIGDTSDTNAPGNVWRTASTWPPVKATPTRYYFHGDRSLSTSKPGTHAPLTYTYDPKNPAPTVGGIQLTIPSGPFDQKKVEERADVLVFTSAPLTEPLEVTGRVRVKLWISSDAPDTDFLAKLCDVYPDGRSFNLCEGALRARFRDGLEREKLLEQDRVYPLEIDLWSTSVIFNRGHRLRVQVTSSSAPGYDPNPNTGEPFRGSERVRVVRNSVFVDAHHPSHIVLPVAK